jgi:hypothetical protein
MTPQTPPTTQHIVRDGIARAVTAVGLAGVALVHLLDVTGKFSETPYMGWMFVGLIGAALATAFALVRGSSPQAWLAAGGLAASAIAGFVLTRTVGLPQAMGDIGNWSEPLGMASLLVEGLVVAVSAGALAEKAAVRRSASPVRQAVRRAPTPRAAGQTTG